MTGRDLIILDTVVLSNYAASRSIDTRPLVLDQPVTVPAVVSELERGAREGYSFTERALRAIDQEIPVVEPSGPVVDRFEEAVDSGEAAVLGVALDRDGVAATDDRSARDVAEDEGIPVTGSIGILLKAVDQGEVSPETADEWIDQWIERTGYFSPVDSIEELR